MTYRKAFTREQWHPDAGLQSDELGSLADVIKFMLAHEAITTLAGIDEDPNNRFKPVDTSTSADFVVRDEITGFFIKGTRCESLSTEFRAMNYLNEALAKASVGITAVRHAYIVKPSYERLPTVSVVEPAKGETLKFLYEAKNKSGTPVPEPLDKRFDASVSDARGLLAEALPRQAMQYLISDLHHENVLLDTDGVYTVIDQPSPNVFYEANEWLDTLL